MIYIAGPFFNEEQVALIVRIENALKAAGIWYFSPRLKGVLVDATPEQRVEMADKIYQSNVNNIISAGGMIAVIDNFDPGTMFEVGYARAMDVPIVSITGKDYGLNVMLAKSVQAHTNDPMEAVKAISGRKFQGFCPKTVT